MTRRQDDLEGGGRPRLTLGRWFAVVTASALATLAMAILVVAVVGLWAFNSDGPKARQGAATTVILRHGASLSEIASNLEDQNVVRSASVFMAAVQVTGAGRALKAGEYSVPSRASLGQVLTMIRLGKIVRHHVTIPEGTTSDQAVAILMANPVLSGSVAAPAEGAILPETYEVERGDDRAGVMQRMIVARDRVLAELWPSRSGNLPFKTPEEAMVLASIVEKETGKTSERPRVAAVFVNRLAQHIRLESDPTIIYGLTRGQPLGRGIRESELKAPSPYNTYVINGLPPTPICNPGRAAIAAVLDPAKTGDLYFVANGTGGHSFASNYEDHKRNVAHWREVEQARAGRPATPAMSSAPASSSGPAAPSSLRGELRNGH